MQRITKKMFLKKVERLEKAMGIKLTFNIWEQHYSVYTQGKNDSCHDEILTAQNARDAVMQIRAIENAIGILNKGGK